MLTMNISHNRNECSSDSCFNLLIGTSDYQGRSDVGGVYRYIYTIYTPKISSRFVHEWDIEIAMTS